MLPRSVGWCQPRRWSPTRADRRSQQPARRVAATGRWRIRTRFFTRSAAFAERHRLPEIREKGTRGTPPFASVQVLDDIPPRTTIRTCSGVGEDAGVFERAASSTISRRVSPLRRCRHPSRCASALHWSGWRNDRVHRPITRAWQAIFCLSRLHLARTSDPDPIRSPFRSEPQRVVGAGQSLPDLAHHVRVQPSRLAGGEQLVVITSLQVERRRRRAIGRGRLVQKLPCSIERTPPSGSYGWPGA